MFEFVIQFFGSILHKWALAHFLVDFKNEFIWILKSPYLRVLFFVAFSGANSMTPLCTLTI